MQEKLDSLRVCLGNDGVHLTEQGRFHLFNNLAKTVLSLKDGSIGKPPKPAEAAACSLISGRKYYWRGFESDRGSTSRPSAGRGGGRGGRGPGRARGSSSRQRVTPYSRQDAAASGSGGTARRGGRWRAQSTSSQFFWYSANFVFFILSFLKQSNFTFFPLIFYSHKAWAVFKFILP